MKKFKNLLLSAALVFGVTLSVAAFAQADYARAACSSAKECACEGSGSTYSGGKCTNADAPGGGDLTKIFKTITNILLLIIGAVAVIVLIIAGLRYVTSSGDASKVKAAKDTILYAVVGIIVALLAYAIVNFVINAIS